MTDATEHHAAGDGNATPDRVARLRAALLMAIPMPPDDWPVGTPFVVDVRVQESTPGEFTITANQQATRS